MSENKPNTNNSVSNSIEPWFVISKNGLIGLIIWYITLLLAGIVGTVICILYKDIWLTDPNIGLIAIIGGAATATMASTIFYIRKLYKAAISKEILSQSGTNSEIQSIGGILYYSLRPIFAICFSLIVHVGIRSSVIIVDASKLKLEPAFIFAMMIISTFIGFAAGDMLDRIVEYSKNAVEKTAQNLG